MDIAIADRKAYVTSAVECHCGGDLDRVRRSCGETRHSVLGYIPTGFLPPASLRRGARALIVAG